MIRALVNRIEHSNDRTFLLGLSLAGLILIAAGLHTMRQEQAVEKRHSTLACSHRDIDQPRIGQSQHQ